jgi:hypothetical protein
MRVPEDTSRASGGGWFSLVGGLLIVAGSLLPWTHAQVLAAIVDRNGMQLGANSGFSVVGLVTLILGLITCLIGLSTVAHFQMPRFVQRSSIITGVVAAALVALNIPTLEHYVQTVQATSALAQASLGYGLWLVFIGCALSITGGLVVRASRNTSTLDDISLVEL